MTFASFDTNCYNQLQGDCYNYPDTSFVIKSYISNPVLIQIESYFVTYS